MHPLSLHLPSVRPNARAFLAMSAIMATGLCSQPGLADDGPAASAGAREDLLRRCPSFQKQWEVAVGPDSSSGDMVGKQGLPNVTVRRTNNGFEVGKGDEFGELFLQVELPSCASLGYSWWAEYAGGTHIPDAVHPMLWRSGVRISWRALESHERTVLLRLMKAGLGSATSTSISGALWRTRHPAAAQQPPTQPEPPIGQLVGIPLDSEAGRPRNESRVFIPCPPAAHTTDGPEAADGWLFFGSRLSTAKNLNGLGISQAAMGPTETGRGVGRVFGPQPWLVIHDRNADRTVFLPDNRSGMFAGSTVYAAGAIAADAVTSSSERAVILGGTQGCNARLLDLTRLRAYSLPGGCPYYDSGSDYSFLSGDLAGRIVWFKPRPGSSASDGAVIDYVKVLQSQGAEGTEIVPAASTLAWGVTHKNLNVILTALLFADVDQKQNEALAALRGLPGWEDPTEPLVGVRAAARKPRLLAEKEDGRSFDELNSNEQSYALVGFVKDEALLIISERVSATAAVARPREGGAIVAVPRSAVFPASFLPRLEELRRTALDHELFFGPAKGDRYVSYPEAVVTVLSRRPLTAREKQRACAVEKELLAGHERWELEEIVEHYWDTWAEVTSEGESEHPPRLRPGAIVRAEWKAMCPARGNQRP